MTGVQTCALPIYIILNPGSGVVDATSAEVHTQKVELWRDGYNRGAILAHPSDGSLTVAATGWLHLESHDGQINIDSDNGQVAFNNNIYIHSDGRITTENSDLTLSSDSDTLNINTGYINATYNNSEMHLGKIELWENSNQYGIIAKNGYQLKFVATDGELTLDTQNGTVYIQAAEIDARNNNSQMYLRKTEYWQNGDQYGVITNNGNTFKQIEIGRAHVLNSSHIPLSRMPSSA